MNKQHFKEWKKKNYFGGFEEDDNMSELSYKTDSSKDINEWNN
jgi:hypothetical protein